MANELQNFTNLDFDSIKGNLVQYMKTKQGEGKLEGFEFEGSTMNMIMDLLAYNTQYNAYYMNMMASERYIGTAQKRSSVVNLAKNLGYTPRSATGATAFISGSVTPVDSNSVVIIPAGTKFTSKKDSKTFTYFTESVLTLSEDFTFSNVKLKEGAQLEFKKKLDVNRGSVTLPNKNVDTKSIRVFVSNNQSDIGIEYLKENDFSVINSTTETFFVEETDGDLYRIFFGDDVIGRSVIEGQYVTVTYNVSSGEDGNLCRTFSLADSIPNVSSLNITNATVSQQGANPEDIDSIRKSATSFFQRQNRAVTAGDYKSIVSELFPSAADVTAYGGEELIEPAFGFVFISILFSDGTVLSDTRKFEIVKTLKDRYSALSVRPVVVDPFPLYLQVKSLVRYDSRRKNPGILNIKDRVVESVKRFAADNTLGFDREFTFSRFVRAIDDTDTSIISNRSAVTLYAEFDSQAQLSRVEDFSFGQPIVRGSVRSNEFVFAGQRTILEANDREPDFLDVKIIAPDGTRILIAPKIVLINSANGSAKIVDNNAVDLSQFFVSPDQPLRVFADIQGGDTKSNFNNVIILRDADIDVEVIDDVTGSKTGNVNFNVGS